MGQDEDREVTYRSHGQNSLHLGKSNLLSIKIELDGKKQRQKDNKPPSPHTPTNPSFHRFNFTPSHLTPLPTTQCGGGWVGLQPARNSFSLPLPP